MFHKFSSFYFFFLLQGICWTTISPFFLSNSVRVASNLTRCTWIILNEFEWISSDPLFVQPEVIVGQMNYTDLYGICGCLSTSAVITLPSVNRLWLILTHSRARSFFAGLSEPALLMFSEPARSTRFSLPIFISSSPSGLFSFMWTTMVKTVWERLWIESGTLINWNFEKVVKICSW